LYFGRLIVLGRAHLWGEGVMGQFSAVDAATEGFRLMKRRPGVTISWIVAWMVLAFGPIIALAAVLMPHLQDWLSQLRDLPVDGPAGRFSAIHMAFLSLIAPWLLWYMAAETIIAAAIYRAVLEPRSSGFAYLRLGMDEVRLFLLRIVLFLLSIFFLCLLIGSCIAVFAAAQAAPEGTAPWIDAAAILLALAAGAYVPVRLSFAGPMTFARKRIEVFGSWRRTRGRFWNLVLMILVIFVFSFVLTVVAQGLAKAAIAVLGDWRSMAGLERLGDDPKAIIEVALRALGPGLIVACIIQGVADTLLRIVRIVPFAVAYRELGGSSVSAPAAGGLPVHA
jgi:hypothetical protein